MKTKQLSASKITLRELLFSLTVAQLWGVLGALVALCAGATSIGYYAAAQQLNKTDIEFKALRQAHQALLSRNQFFERAFEYYKAKEQWHKSIGLQLPEWTSKYPCDGSALALTTSLETLRKTIDRLRDYGDRSEIGVIDPRAIQVTRIGGSLQIRFLSSGETWAIPDRSRNLNPDGSIRPSPCE